MPSSRLQQQIEFLRAIDKLKTINRKSYIADGSRRENSAEHSWHVSMAALVLTDCTSPGLDQAKLIRMLLLHDVIEAYAGDTNVYDSTAIVSQAKREAQAAEELFTLLPQDQSKSFQELWREFELGETTEAQYARTLDRLMPLLHNYWTGGKRWKEDGISHQQVFEINKPIRENGGPLADLADSILAECLKSGYFQNSEST